MKKLFSAILALTMLSGCAIFNPDCSTFGKTGSDTVYFDFDSSVIRPDAAEVLNHQATVLNKKDGEIVVAGHADERGTREYNLALGARRANAVSNYLVARGVDAERISTISYGKERPAVLGNNEEAWSKNRRAVTILEDLK